MLLSIQNVTAGETADLMIKLSLLLNILVLIPVCVGIVKNADWVQESYGDSTPARSILLSIYIAILFCSGMLLVYPRNDAVAALLFVQIVYKLTTPLTVGTLRNPVVISNLLIAVFHMITLSVIFS